MKSLDLKVNYIISVSSLWLMISRIDLLPRLC